VIDTALIGLAGVVAGVLLGGAGKYWTQRRDAWKEARASGLLLLAHIRALQDTQPSSRLVSDSKLGVIAWEEHQATLAGFRRGSFPNGLKAAEWLRLAERFARLAQLHSRRNDGWWRDPTSLPDAAVSWWNEATAELQAADLLLADFANDPPVVLHAILLRFLPKRP
jgi:hypothetical protein